MFRIRWILLGIVSFSVSGINCGKAPPESPITLTYPNGGEYWAIGRYHRVLWASERIRNVIIQLSRDGGNNWDTVQFEPWWKVSGNTSSNCLIKVSARNDSSIHDISDNTFTIAQDAIEIASPNGGEVWITETRQTINWKSDDKMGYVEIFASRDKGNSWEELSVPGWNRENYGTVDWVVGEMYQFPNPITSPSTNCLIKVVDRNQPSSYDISDSIFTIVRHIQVNKPDGSEFMYPVDTLPIHWTTSGLGGKVSIEYSPTGWAPWDTIISSIPDTGSCLWEIPQTPGDNVKVKITHLKYAENSDVNYHGFTILRRIQVTAPTANDTLYANQVYDIKWSTAAVSGDVRIEYHDGIGWNSVISSVPDTGSFSWLVPDSPTDSAKIAIAHLRYMTNTATSGTFTIIKETQ